MHSLYVYTGADTGGAGGAISPPKIFSDLRVFDFPI